MLAISRVGTGDGLGQLLPAIPLDLAEVAPPHSRALMVGQHGDLPDFWPRVPC
jgi:hypothetical protein